jgi:hypothetical protein
MDEQGSEDEELQSVSALKDNISQKGRRNCIFLEIDIFELNELSRSLLSLSCKIDAFSHTTLAPTAISLLNDRCSLV